MWGCGGGGSSDRLVDKSVPELDALCTEHELIATRTCPSSPGGFCNFLYRGGSCREIMLMLPSDCDATADDYIACAQATCSSYGTECAAFTACGVSVYRPGSSSCG